MTTAYYRTLALDLESRLEWQRAAEAWDAAIKAYPKHAGSALFQRDTAMMSERREQCEIGALDRAEARHLKRDRCSEEDGPGCSCFQYGWNARDVLAKKALS